MLQLLFQRLNLSSFFLHFFITLRGIRCLSNLCGKEFLLITYHISLFLVCGDCLKVYRLELLSSGCIHAGEPWFVEACYLLLQCFAQGHPQNFP